MKKLFAVILALICMTMFVSSALAGTITIENMPEGTYYEAYKILSAENNVYTIDADAPWCTILDSPSQHWLKLTQVATGDSKYVVTKADGVTGTDEDAAKALAAYLKKNKPQGAEAQTLSAGTNTVEDGYYLILTPGPALILDTCGDVTLHDKNEYPALTKSASVESATIGRQFSFTLTLTVPTTVSKDITVHDFIPSGISMIGEAVAEAGGISIAYSASGDATDGQPHEYTFKYSDIAGKTVTIEYNARLNGSAAICDAANASKAWLTYADFTSVESKADVYTYSLGFKKVDGADAAKALPGAEFTLKDDAGMTINVVNTGEEGVYRVADSEETEYANIVTPATGTVIVKGLAGKTGTDNLQTQYHLIETKAPVGYNLATEATDIEIAASNISPDSVTIKNNAGTELPSTGGIGTTIFYIVGGLLMAGALIILIARRKVSAGKR